MNLTGRFPLSLEETQMRTFLCLVFVLYLGLAGTAVAYGGAGVGGVGPPTVVTFLPKYHSRHHHHYAQHVHRKIVTRRVGKVEHHHLRSSGYAEELTPHDDVLSENSITQMPVNKTYTLSAGTPLLGLDPRSPSTWELYSEMLPFIFSEARAASD
jgi:hypothetical protein